MLICCHFSNSGSHAGVVPALFVPDSPSVPLGTGENFEYHTTPDWFLAVQCSDCGRVYLSERPHASELDRIYPPT
jgi:hypothetical protein